MNVLGLFMTVAFTIILGIFGGIFFYFFRSALNPEDAKKIDPWPSDNDLSL